MIRKGNENDAQQIAKIKIDNYQKTYRGIFADEFLKSMQLEDEKNKYLRGLPSRKVLVYEEEGIIQGYIYYGARKNHQEILSDYQGEIYAIYVDIRQMHHGIGTKLIKAALSELLLDYDKVVLWCMTENIDSLRFYRARNFIEMGKEEVLIGEKKAFETAMTFDFEDVKKYRMTRYVAFKEKEDVTAVYANLNLLFLKNETNRWLKQIIRQNNDEKIPVSFYRFLVNKEVIEID